MPDDISWNSLSTSSLLLLSELVFEEDFTSIVYRGHRKGDTSYSSRRSYLSSELIEVSCNDELGWILLERRYGRRNADEQQGETDRAGNT